MNNVPARPLILLTGATGYVSTHLRSRHDGRGAAGARRPGDRAGDGATIRQTAVFHPVGLLGLFYWYGIYPLHARVFAGMLHGTAKAAEALGRHVEDAAGTAENVTLRKSA